MERNQPCVHRTHAFIYACQCCLSSAQTKLNDPESAGTRSPLPFMLSTSIPRRVFLFTLASSAGFPSHSTAQSPPRRTIFDEEKELNEKIQNEAEEARLSALRAGFEAVEKAAVQLDDLEQYASEQDWDGVRRFSRYFNNAVEREGMEPLANKLRDKQQRKAALNVSKQVTEALKLVDAAARMRDRDAALIHVQEARDIISKFQQYKPSVKNS